MNAFDFVTRDELDELPEDPRQAFVEFVRIARERLDQRVVRLDPENFGQLIEDAKYSFVNVIVAAAQRYQINKIAKKGVPLIGDFHEYVYRQFMADLDFYVTDLRLDDTNRRRRESVRLSAKAKDRIRAHIVALRACIETSHLDDAKKAALLRRIEEFEEELEKQRLNILTVTLLVMNVLAIPGGLASSYDVSAKLLTNVLQEVAKEKASEDELRQLPPNAAPALLEGPNRPDPLPAPTKSELDDEIPF